ncbi:hypothetical protein D048_2520 [Vibrio parahaemolyticus VPTS-2009]|nr:hypothetical protein D048_2520 [Vibrio parahaemolyticus VPTS-2009]
MHLKFNQLFGVNELRLKMGELDLVERLLSLDNAVESVCFVEFLSKFCMIMCR